MSEKDGWYRGTDIFSVTPPEPTTTPTEELMDDEFHQARQDDSRAYAPHCDPRVLHAPGECVYCDHYPDWQNYRQVAHIAFTNHPAEDGQGPCPADAVRGVGGAHVWGGNRPRRYATGGIIRGPRDREDDSINPLPEVRDIRDHFKRSWDYIMRNYGPRRSS